MCVWAGGGGGVTVMHRKGFAFYNYCHRVSGVSQPIVSNDPFGQ